MVSIRSGILLVVASNCNGFRMPTNNIPATRLRTTGLQFGEDGKDGPTSSSSSRRDFIRKAAMIAAGGEFFLSQPAEATYTAFTQREADWKAREKSGGTLSCSLGLMPRYHSFSPDFLLRARYQILQCCVIATTIEGNSSDE